MSAKKQPLTTKRIGICADRLFLFCFLSYTCSYIGRKNLSACLPAIIASGLMDKAQAGIVTTAYMAVYGLGQLLWGVIANKVKPQYLIGTGLCGAALCNMLMGFCTDYTPMLFIWAANGIFQAMLWAPIIRVFTDRMPDGKRERAGLNIAPSCSIGAVFAFLLPAVLLRIADWRVVFFVAGGILFAAFLMWTLGNLRLRHYILYMDELTAKRQAAYRAQQSTQDTNISKKRSLPTVILASGVWFLLFSLFCNGALRDAVETWAPTYLAEQFRLDGSMAALTAIIIPIISIPGAYVAEWLYNRFIKNEIYTCALMFAVSFLCMICVYFLRDTNAVFCSICLAVCVSAMFGANHLYLTVLPYRFAPLGLSAGITGFLNCAIYFATALCSSLYGLLAEHYGWEVLTFVWLAISLGGVLFALIGGRLWKSKRQALDEGRL